MAGHEGELRAVCTFLSELSLDEIIRYDDADNGDEVESLDAFSVTGSTTDENSDDEDVQRPQYPAKKRAGKTKTPAQKVRQSGYDKKCRSNKKVRHKAACEEFVAILPQFIGLLRSRVAVTKQVVGPQTLASEYAAAIAHEQILLNRGAVRCIRLCTSGWERGNKVWRNFFMRKFAREINQAMETLRSLEQQLNAATSELEWRLQGKTDGVWV